MADPLDALPPDSAPAPRPEPIRDDPRGLPKKIECQFCHSQLTPYGDVLKMGDDAKAFRDSEEKRERLVAELAGAQDTIRELERKVSELDAEVKRRKSSIFGG